MAEVINMPRLSDTMEEGTVATWLKQVGDKVTEGDILAEIETDKATMEFESFYEGTLLYVGIQEGENAPVDSLLAIIGDEGEDISGLLNGGSSDTAVAKDAPAPSQEAPTADSNELPEGVEVITMPRLSDTMTEGTVATWLKKEGDEVAEGGILAEIETDKATMEFESFYTGTLLKIGIQEGGSAPVDAVLAILGPAGTDVSRVSMGSAPAAAPAEAKKEVQAPVKKEKKATPAPSAPAATPVTSNGGRVFASPLAKKMAENKGINLASVQGSGENGRVIKKDIENYVPAAAGATAAAFVPVGTETWESHTNSQMRKTIAKRLGQSKFTAPHYYLGIELDMDQAIASRKSINALPDTKISYNDMVIKACAMALRLHPKVNSQWTDKETRIAKHIHVGVAVAVDDGLVVPVLEYADQMSFMQIGGKVRELAGKARNKKLQPSDMDGSTFTVSNLGMFGIQEFTSIINQPNSAIMSVGAIEQKPVVKDGQIVVGNTMKITLACDHRTVDGATGAQFLATFRQYMENPITMFV